VFIVMYNKQQSCRSLGAPRLLYIVIARDFQSKKRLRPVIINLAISTFNLVMSIVYMPSSSNMHFWRTAEIRTGCVCFGYMFKWCVGLEVFTNMAFGIAFFSALSSCQEMKKVLLIIYKCTQPSKGSLTFLILQLVSLI